MLNLGYIINISENLEVKRVLAVKMIILDFKTSESCSLLDVSD